ncbi:MAG: BolA family transcriptional regulator [Gammaproteobacteria bacterium]|nr:BolA family transcriptional regulator [Gammaproteobacteria bacterium]MCY4181605.1 BolA family transcriptional regulator [Gammaproteobacteria bacterium]MCY4296152.1 BolA family transcriptional regulator [Gammaproteobacteria bacterium]
MQAVIEAKVRRELAPAWVEVRNESHMHGGPATDSHFRLTAVAAEFAGMNRVRRHQLVYRLLADELAGGVHALALHLYTPDEWKSRGGDIPASPDCRGGGKSQAPSPPNIQINMV